MSIAERGALARIVDEIEDDRPLAGIERVADADRWRLSALDMLLLTLSLRPDLPPGRFRAFSSCQWPDWLKATDGYAAYYEERCTALREVQAQERHSAAARSMLGVADGR